MGSPSLVGFNISSSVPAGLVLELVAEHRPASIEHGLGHPHRTRAASVVGATRLGECSLVSAIVPEYGHGRAVPAGSERLQAEVNADLAGPCGELIRDLALEVDVSAPARVRTKTGLDLAPISRDSQNWYRRLRVGDIGTVDLYGAPDKRHPSRLFLAERQPGPRRMVSRRAANSRQMVWTVSEWRPSSAAFPVQSLIKSKADSHLRCHFIAYR